MVWWVPLAVMGGTWALGKLVDYLRPEDEVQRPRAQSVDFPLAEEGHPIPLIYGHVRVRNPLTIYWSGERTTHDYPGYYEEIEPEYTRGTLQMAICAGVENPDLTAIYYGDKRIWSGFAYSSTAKSDESRLLRDLTNPISPAAEVGLWITLPLKWPNEKFGLYGKVRWYPGTFTQDQNSHLATAQSPDPVPSYRGISYFLVENGLVAGSGGRPDALSFEVRGYPDAIGGAPTREIGNKANPIEVIYDLLTGGYGRLGLDPGLIHVSDFAAAVATIYDETDGVSVLIDTPTAAIDVIREMLDHVDAVMYIDPMLGRIRLKLVRDDYTSASLDEFTDSDLAGDPEQEITTWEDSIDEIRATYEAKLSSYKPTTVIAQNMATYYGRSPNRKRTGTLKYRFIRSWSSIQQIVSRELAVVSQPIRRARIPFNRSAIDLRPGDVFRWTSTRYGFTDRVMRVGEVDFGTDGASTIMVSCFEDRFALQKDVYADPDEIDPSPLDPPAEATVKKTIEVPKLIAMRGKVEGYIADSDNSHPIFFARPANSETVFRAWESNDAGSTYNEDPVGDLRFAQTFLVETAYDRLSEPYDTTTGLRIKNVSDTTMLKSATGDDISDLQANIVIVGDELIAYETYTDLGGGVYRLNNVWRGHLDTVPADHAVNERGWFLDDDSVWLRNIGHAGFTGTDALKIKLSPRLGPLGVSIDSVAAEDLQLVERPLLPYPPDDVDVDGSKEYPGVTVQGETNKWIVTSEVTSSWARRRRGKVIIARGDDADEDPDETADPSKGPTTYDVDVDLGDGFVNIGNESGATGTHDLQDVADGAGTLRIRAKRVDPAYLGDDGATRYSFQAQTVAAQIAHYRQLLVNPHFDDATSGRGWTAVSGTPIFTASADSYGFAGTHLTCTATVRLEQVVDLTALGAVGKDSRLTFYARELGAGGAASVRVRLYSETSGSVVVDTADTGSFTPSSANWDRIDVNLAGIGATAAQLRVRIDLIVTTNEQPAVDAMDLRLSPDIGVNPTTSGYNLVTNGGFNSDLAGWTVTNFIHDSSNPSEGAGHARGDCTATQTMYKEITLPTGIADGDVAHMRAIFKAQDSTMKGWMSLKAYDGSTTLLDEIISTTLVNFDDGEWHEQDLYLKIPSGATKVRCYLYGSQGTLWGPDVDDVSLYVYSAVGESAGVGAATGASAVTAVGASTARSAGAATGASTVVGFSGA